MRAKPLAVTLTIALGAAFAAACSDTALTADDSSLVASAADSVDQTTSESALMIVATSRSSDTASADDVAAAAAAGAGQAYSPPSCVSATQNGPEVTYTLNDCSGPYGLVHVSGELVAVFARVDNSALQVTATGTNLSVNQATIDLSAVGVYSRNADGEQLAVTTQSNGVGRRNQTLSRTGSYTVGWVDTTQCVSVDGTWATVVGGTSWTTTVAGFEKCGASCPSAGGTVTYTGDQGKTFTVAFDGSETAGWVSSGGRAGTMSLYCAP